MNLHNIIIDYVESKQSMGMRFNSEAVILKSFCKTLGNVDIDDVEADLVMAYLVGRGPITSFWHRKFEALSGFYRYAIGRGYVRLSPLPSKKPERPKPYVAYIYTTEEFHRLLAATDILEKSRCHVDTVTFRTLLLLLFNTGLRIGEVMSLTLADVSPFNNLLTIRETKFFKNRLVPIDPRLGSVLYDYSERKHTTSQNEHSPFFVKRNGLALTHTCVERTFRKLCNYCGIHREDGARYQPRLHDIRHTFALSRLLDWYRKGADVQRLLPHLSTYLGHVNISATQRYLTMTSELLSEASSRFEKYALSEVKHV